MSEQTIHIRAVVSGIVQGVGFRFYTQHQAERLGLAGSVLNRPDGKVECELEGPADAVSAMVDWLHQGPRSARVTGVETTPGTVTGTRGFRVAG